MSKASEDMAKFMSYDQPTETVVISLKNIPVGDKIVVTKHAEDKAEFEHVAVCAACAAGRQHFH